MCTEKKLLISILTIPALIFLILSLQHTYTPGIYMDSVNPDYLSAWLLKGSKVIPAWCYPDNYLAGMYQYPLLNSLYGGNPTAYLATVFFWITGFGLEQLRVFHAIIGTALLVSWVWCLRKWKCPVWIIVLCALGLAVEPNFFFSWRTQFYLQLTPGISLFFALGLLGQNYFSEKNNCKKKLAIAGVLLGFAAYCYFIYAFYAAAIIVIYTLFSPNIHYSKAKTFTLLSIFAIVGWSPYIYAHLSIILNIGFDGYITQLKDLQNIYQIGSVNPQFQMSRLDYLGNKLGALFGAAGLETLILKQHTVSDTLRMLHSVFLVVPVLTVFAIATVVKTANTKCTRVNDNDKGAHAVLPAILAGIIIMHMLFAIVIGTSLGLQHIMPLIPISAACLATTLSFTAKKVMTEDRIKRSAIALMALIMAGNVIIDCVRSWQLMGRLSTESAQPFYSTTINTMAEELKDEPEGSVLLFPQWGLWMGAVTLLGPKYDVLEAQDIPGMIEKLNSNNELLKRNNYTLVLGYGINGDDKASLMQHAETFAKAMQFSIVKERTIQDMNKKDGILIVSFSR